jgi:hypothetical protein
MAHVVEGLDGASARTSRVFTLRQPPGPVIAVVALQGELELTQSQTAGSEGGRVGDDLEAAYLAAQAIDVGHAGTPCAMRAGWSSRANCASQGTAGPRW